MYQWLLGLVEDNVPVERLQTTFPSRPAAFDSLLQSAC
jgi:hypothetical protein